LAVCFNQNDTENTFSYANVGNLTTLVPDAPPLIASSCGLSSTVYDTDFYRVEG
jgi:hypothetical protein